MASSPICVVDPLHACRCCSARSPEECPYRYLLADAATLEGWASTSVDGTSDGTPDRTSDRVEEPEPGV